jgi:predicted nucleic-acid-binding Zn-ribbon protein
MMERNIKCPKCQRAMQKGYIPDATYGGVVLGTWVEGEVETGFLGAIKLKGKTRRTITTYRCNSCGYQESADPQDNATTGSCRRSFEC